MSNSFKIICLFFIVIVVLFLAVPVLQRRGIFKARTQAPGTVVVPVFVTPNPTTKSLQLYTFPFVTTTPTPTTIPFSTSPPYSPKHGLTGSVQPPPSIDSPSPAGKQYCVDEAPGTVTIEFCDDPTRCDVAHGGGGVSGRCGTVIGWEHTIIEFLLGNTNSQYNLRLSDNLSTAIRSSCYGAEPYSPYISTFNVIDAYNLAGFHDFSRGQHAGAGALESAWKTTAGYTVSATANGAAPGDVIFFSNPPHVGILNTIEVDARGNGDIWFLHTGGAYYMGKLMVAEWKVVASSTGDNNVTFGSNRSKGPDATQGETICYCESGICYRYKFNRP